MPQLTEHALTVTLKLCMVTLSPLILVYLTAKAVLPLRLQLATLHHPQLQLSTQEILQNPYPHQI
jgi:hypothetical protein